MSDPAALAAASGTSGTTGSSGANPSSRALPPADYIITAQTFSSDSNWPSDLVLDTVKANWQEWDRRLRLIVDQRGFGSYLNGTLPCPDASKHAGPAYSWTISDLALRAFILQHVSDHDYDVASLHQNSHDVYTTLRDKHQNQGPFAKIKLFKEALGTRFAPGIPLSRTFDQISKLHARFIKMGKLSDDELLSMFVLNALCDHYPRLQTSINDMMMSPSNTSSDIRTRLLQEEHTTQLEPSVANAALTGASSRPPRPVCSNCKRTGHRAEYCIAPGGQMAGKTLDEARAAQDAARTAQRAGSNPGKPHGTRNSANSAITTNPIATATPGDAKTTFTLNGKSYMFLPNVGSNSTSQIVEVVENNANNAFSAISMQPYDEAEYMAVIATTDEPQVTLNWKANTRPPTVPDDCAYPSGRAPIAHAQDLPFILDSGATCHISPEASDFKILKSIPRRPVKGLCGSAVFAVGMGDIELHIAGGHTLKLTDVLYIPESSVRLISILALNRCGDYTTHFDSAGCWITNKSNTTIVRGSLSASKRLYILTTKTPSVQRSRTLPTAQALSALVTRVPDIETWHRRLGHCNTRAIVEMAKNEVSQGMPIDLSCLPPKCDHCAIGKQTRSPVPKLREGAKATKRLERVYVDLCGPMPVSSRSGNLYCMNLIDDFSGYVWAIPLRSKSEACPALQIWHKAVTVQTEDTLRILITDNGELVSKSTQTWCQTHGIDHQTTAPYTSAQNGRVERLHRTINEKARTMRLACNAPGFLWDEFFLTAAYLTSLTAATSNRGRTPFELWFGRTPSLSHLREIGCRAFALTQPSPSKIYARSNPFILIGYAPHSKAYRLWDPVSSRIFNSFHVTFTEHLDADPAPFRPGTILGTTSASSPPSWDVCGPVPPESPGNADRPFSSTSHNFPSTSLPFNADPSTISIIPYNTSATNTQSNNTLQDPAQSNTINTTTQSNNIVTQSNNTFPSTTQSHNNNVNTPNEITPRLTTQSDTVLPSDNIATPSNPNTDTQSNTTPPSQRPLTIRIPPRPPPCRSPRLQNSNPPMDHSVAFLTEYSYVRDTHDLFPTDIILDGDAPSIDSVLSALGNGSLEPTSFDDDEPTWAQAMASSEREYWIAGGRDEIKSLQDLNVFVLVPRSEVPRGLRPLKGKLVCKRKRDDTGKVVRYKVRYVAKGFAQRYGIDYDKTTAPTVRLESFRSILHIAASLDWDLRQFDIKTAFLHGILPEDETMFMEQPYGFAAPGKEEWVMRLMKSIYGMKQASRIWNQTFHKAVTQWGFERLDCEWCVYRRTSPTGTTIFAVHVDDIIATGSSPSEINDLRDSLKSQWEITELGEPKLALGITISRDRENRTVSLSQTAKIDKVVEEFGQRDARTVDTPMVAGLQLRRPDKSAPVPTEIAEWADKTPYRSLVGSLMYFAVASRPDISYAVGRLSSFLDCYRPEHWEAAIRVLRYLKGTRSHALILGGRNALTLSGFSDSDYANCIDTSRSIGGYCFTLGSGMISWSSKKQATVADSSCYAEYIALHDASHEVVFLRQLLEGMQFLPSGATTVLCDNDAASRLTEDHVWHSHTKHIRVKYHHTRELVLAGDVAVSRVGSKDNTADILTKPLGRMDFQRLRHYLGVRGPAEPSTE